MNTLIAGQTDFLLKLRIDYANGSQVNENYLQYADDLAILYRFEKSDPSLDDETGEWPASYEFSGTTPYLIYEFAGLDEVPEDGEGYLNVRAKITGADGRTAYGKIAHIQVLRQELI